MSVYTKTGDRGETSLVGGKRTSKANQKLNAYGSIDELNSFLGLLKSKLTDKDKKDIIEQIQNSLFVVGAILATPAEQTNKIEFDSSLITKLEKEIDEMQEQLPKLRNFIVYGDNEPSAICHVCRAVTRRAERDIVKLTEIEEVDDTLVQYINRLSDFLFVLARILSKLS